MVLLDGKKTANDIKDEITISVNEMTELGEKVPHLAAVLVGSDGASSCLLYTSPSPRD